MFHSRSAARRNRLAPPFVSGTSNHLALAGVLARLVLMIGLSSSSLMFGQSSTFNVVYPFTPPDSSSPKALVLSQANALYGTAYGGLSNAGVIFEMSFDGRSLKTVYDFAGAQNGSEPNGQLIIGTDGALYGTTQIGGTNQGGSVFRFDPNAATVSALHLFQGATDGAEPVAGLIQGADGALYGTTSSGGSSNAGTVFKINLDGSAFTLLHTFTNTPDGATPRGRLTQGTNGFLYGTTLVGGTSNLGTLFRIDTNGNNYQVFHSFTDTPDGSRPASFLTQAGDGNLYSTTGSGGANGAGTVFKIGANGSGYQLIYQFNNTPDGAFPNSGLVAGFNNDLYGVTLRGGSADSGTVYRIFPGGTGYSIVYNFTNGSDGRLPLVELTRGPSAGAGTNMGVLYGTTQVGGINSGGVVFAITVNPPLTLTPLNNQTVAFWPAWAQNFLLQTTTNVSTGPWVTLTNYTPLIGAQLTNTAPNSFFRLVLPP